MQYTDKGCNSLLPYFPASQGTPLPLPPSAVLLLPEVGPQDQGTYSCVATHPSHGPQESQAVSISIIGETSPQIPGTLCRLQFPTLFWHCPQEPSHISLSRPTPRPWLPHPNLPREQPSLSPLHPELKKGKTPLGLPLNSPFPN